MKVIILTHGGWGVHLLQSIKMIVGEIDFVSEVPLLPADTLQDYINKVNQHVGEVNDSVIFLTDLFGGTTSNVALLLARKKGYRAICGLSASLLLEVCSQIQNNHFVNFDEIIEVGKNACVDLVYEFKRKKGGKER